MAKSRRPPAGGKPPGVTPERAIRWCRLLRLIGTKGLARAPLLKRLKLDVRAFYRDLEDLRKIGIRVELEEGKYTLDGDPEAVILRLPFPDPQLTLGEARLLSKGRSAVHRKLKGLIEAIT
jgi:hypothetical protein